MEGITRLVDDSMARHGFYVPVDHRRLQWSPWLPCASCTLQEFPSAAGIYTLAEEILAPGEIPATKGKRMLAVVHVAEADDLCVALSRHFAPAGPFRDRLVSGRCYVRFVEVSDALYRQSACNALQQWVASSVEAATGLSRDVTAQFDAVPARRENPQTTTADGSPPPLPGGF